MRRQRGVTMIGWVVLLVPVALVLYAGIRVGPEYYNYYKLSTAMSDTAKQLESDETLSPQNIIFALEKRFDVGYIDHIQAKEVEVAKVDGGWSMTADYDVEVPMFGNLFLLLAFEKTVKINN